MTALQTDQELLNITNAIEKTKDIVGEIIEIGVFEGGSAKVIYDSMGDDKILFLCDTFEGLKDSTEDNDVLGLKNGAYAADFETVKALFPNQDRIRMIKGYFPDSATTEMKELKFSFAHLDVDTYTSTLNSLEFVYSRMNKGGIIISHDYGQIPAVTRAIDEFFKDKPETIDAPVSTQMMVEKL
jgi:hypothetical protein